MSTALITIGLLFSPIWLFAMPPVYLPEEAGFIRNFFMWLQDDLPIALFTVAFLITLVAGGIAVARKNWIECTQYLGEMVICFIAVLVAPMY